MAEQIAYNMDCMEAMRQMPDNAFDLAICDPPYGIGITGTPGGATSSLSHSAVLRERERERDAASGGQSHSEVKIQVGGGLLCRPKATTPSTTQCHRMQSISLS